MQKRDAILIILPVGQNTNRDGYIRQALSRFGVARVVVVEPNKKFKYWAKKPGTKKAYACDFRLHSLVSAWLQDHVERFDITAIVSMCDGTNTLLLKDHFYAKATSSAKLRGSIFHDVATVPYVVIDDIAKCYTRKYSAPVEVSDVYEQPRVDYADPDYAEFIFLRDMQRLVRASRGKLRRSIRFDYTLCDTIAACRSARDFLVRCIAIGSDIETVAVDLSCIGYTGIDSNGEVKSFCLPLMRPDCDNWLGFNAVELREYLEIVKQIQQCPARKIYHNGSYDSAILIRYGLEPHNYDLDTLHMMHSLHPYARKSLGFAASIYNDDFRYWKDDIKGAEDDADKKEYSLPYTREGLEIYWRYCALDTWNTLVVYFHLAEELMEHKWAVDNYAKEIALSLGPMFAMSMHGLVIDTAEQSRYRDRLENVAFAALDNLKTAVGNADFNPNSDAQVAWLVYDVLGCRDEDGSRSVDKRRLRFLADDNPYLARFCSWLWDYKQANNNLGKYVRNLKPYRGRFLSSFGIAQTYTGRCGSKSHFFWCGTNAQNIPGEARPIFRADKGYFYVEVDYGQSDNYFVAFSANDPVMIDTVLNDQDTHAIHCELVLGTPYEQIVTWRKHDPKKSAEDKHKYEFVEHPITGVRQITKKVTHGSNYGMQYKTMYINVGKPAVVAAAAAMGIPNASRLNRTELEEICARMQVRYNSRYPVTAQWRVRIVDEIYASGGLVQCYGGRTHRFLLHPSKRSDVQRAASGFYGQGGTAGNINGALLRYFYAEEGCQLRQSPLYRERTETARYLAERSGSSEQDNRFAGWRVGAQYACFIVLQVHDSLSFMIPTAYPELGNNCLSLMDHDCILNGHAFRVPIEAEASYFWTKKGIKWPRHVSAESGAAIVAKLATR